MRKEDILREELNRMRKLMGMSGQLYQKPIMEDESKHHGDVQPDPRNYKGGESNPQYQSDFKHWSAEHQSPPRPSPPSPRPSPPSPPSPPASPPPSPPASPPPAAAKNITKSSSKAKSKTGTGSRSALDSGEFVVPINQRSGKGKRARSQNKRIRGKGKIKQSKTSNVKKTKGRKKKED
tara:strand:- start:836 stop:1372 length:537 start_codon:yes stop_codon:yes gene_type:complete